MLNWNFLYFLNVNSLVFYFKSLAELKQLCSADLICSYQKGLFEVTAIVWLVTKLKDTLISSTKLKLFIGLFNKEDILLVYVS